MYAASGSRYGAGMLTVTSVTVSKALSLERSGRPHPGAARRLQPGMENPRPSDGGQTIGGVGTCSPRIGERGEQVATGTASQGAA